MGNYRHHHRGRPSVVLKDVWVLSLLFFFLRVLLPSPFAIKHPDYSPRSNYHLSPPREDYYSTTPNSSYSRDRIAYKYSTAYPPSRQPTNYYHTIPLTGISLLLPLLLLLHRPPTATNHRPYMATLHLPMNLHPIIINPQTTVINLQIMTLSLPVTSLALMTNRLYTTTNLVISAHRSPPTNKHYHRDLPSSYGDSSQSSYGYAAPPLKRNTLIPPMGTPPLPPTQPPPFPPIGPLPLLPTKTPRIPPMCTPPLPPTRIHLALSPSQMGQPPISRFP